MKLTTIFSKTGKGLQEASGKTSHLSRADRAILMAIDGKLSVAELAQRVGKPADFKFQQLVEKLDTQGFIREVAPVPSAATSAPRPPSVITPRPASSTPASSGDDGDDLDFTQAFSLPRKPASPSKPVDLAAKAHETAGPGGAAFDYKARAEAEAKAKAEAEKKAKAEAEARAKAIAEAKAKAEAEARQREAEKAKVWARELAEAEAKAARDAIARAEAEEARARKEAEEKKKREEEERKAKAEAERKAKEEAERKAKEEAERKRREEEERKRREEEERKRKEEEERRAKEEAERKAKEEAERKRREEEDRRRREEEERRRKEEEERQRREEEARRRKEEEERKRKEEEERKRREEEERQRREAEERARREEEERKRREEEERQRREEEERLRREEEERKRKEEEERRRQEEEARRQEEERKRKEEEERRRQEDEARRKRREEEDRRRAEEDERRRREDEEQERREAEAREAVERPLREAEERQRLEEDERRAAEDERRRREDEAREIEDRKRREEEALRAKEEALRRKEEELLRKEEEVRRAEEARQRREEEANARREAEAQAQAKSPSGAFDLDFLGKKDEGEGKPAAKPAAKPSVGSFAERLLADLDLFGKKDDEESKRKEEEARKAKEEAAARKAREKEEKKRRDEEAKRAKAEARAREEAERRARIEAEHKAKEEAERKAKEEAERKAQEDIERRAREEQERKSREKRERRRKAAAPSKPTPVSDDDVVVSDDDLGMDDVLRDEAKLTPQARDAARARAREERRREKEGAVVAAPPKFRRPIRWGKPVTIMLLVALVAGAVAIHVMPLAHEPYEQLASNTIGQPVRIGSARMSLVNGFEIRFENVRVGEAFKAREVRAAPEFAWLLGDSTGFRRIDIEGGTLAQTSLAQLLLGKLNEGGLRAQRIIATGLRLDGPLPLPPLDADIQLSSTGTMRFGTLSGPDKLQLKIGRLGPDISIEGRAERLALPFLQELVLGDFYMKATGNAAGLNVSEWDGRLYGGVLKGNARMQWKDGWSVQGELRVVEINAAVFAPALVSAGTAEASGRFALAGPDPAKLGQGARLEGKLAISRGVLGNVDLSRAIQTGGRNVAGRTQFIDLSADGVYDRGAVALRNVVVSAGALSASARLDIAADGRLGGRIAAEVKTPSQQLRTMVELSGTVKEPQASGN